LTFWLFRNENENLNEEKAASAGKSAKIFAPQSLLSPTENSALKNRLIFI
jgi:hypothetical protein